MVISQNATFKCIDFDKSENSIGEQLAQYLYNSLRQDWEKTDPDNWRDCGYFFKCGHNKVKLELIISPMDSTGYFLQISPAYTPNFFGRLAKKQTSANHNDILNFAKEIHSIFTSDERFSDIKWEWNGPPNKNSSAEPLKYVR